MPDVARRFASTLSIALRRSIDIVLLFVQAFP